MAGRPEGARARVGAFRVACIGLRDRDGEEVGTQWSAEVSLGSNAQREGFAVSDSRPVAFDNTDAEEALAVIVYQGASRQPAVYGSAKVSLAKLLRGEGVREETLGLRGEGVIEGDSAWRHHWIALQRNRTFAGSIQLGTLFGGGASEGSPDDPGAGATEQHTYEDMVQARQKVAWSEDRRASRAMLVDLVRAGGIPHSLRGRAWLSLSGAAHRKSQRVQGVDRHTAGRVMEV